MGHKIEVIGITSDTKLNNTRCVQCGHRLVDA